MADFTSLVNFCRQNKIEHEVNGSLSQLTSFKIGGTCDIIINPTNTAQIIDIVKAVQEHDLPMFILGNGSNLLFSDDGLHAAVLHLSSSFGELKLLDETTISCQSGAGLSRLCTFAYENSLSGLEFAYGIPGSVGGAIYMNAGAYGGEMKDVLISTQHITTDGKQGSFSRSELDLSYRHSAYTDSGHIITSGVFKLQKGDKDKIRARMDELMGRRRDKQPLEYPSGGSTFKRPQGGYASELIDRCGLKGRQVGGAKVSEKHAGFVINADKATCKDVLALIEVIKQEVKEKTGFNLECEVKFIG